MKHAAIVTLFACLYACDSTPQHVAGADVRDQDRTDAGQDGGTMSVDDSVAGDWIACSVDGCPQLDRVGFRLTTDGLAYLLWFPQVLRRGDVLPPVQEGDAYCVEAEPVSSYTYNPSDGTLTFVDIASKEVSRLVFDAHGDDANQHRRVADNAVGRWSSFESQCYLE
jgi:hypothetical protein